MQRAIKPDLKASTFNLIEESTFTDAVTNIRSATEIVVDTETSGLEIWKDDRICGIGVYIPEIHQGYYFPFRHKNGEMPLFDSMDMGGELNLPSHLLPILISALQEPSVLIGHNIKFDLAALHQDGFVLQEEQTIYDTITAARLYYPDKYQSLSLDAVTDDLLGLGTESWKKQFKDYLKKNKWTGHFDFAPPDVVGEYCVNDCTHTWEIYKRLTANIEATGQQRVWEQEAKLLRVLWEMEKEGLYFDRVYCIDRIEKIKTKLTQLEQQIFALVGKPFDIRSPKQINEIMAGLGIYSPHLTPAGNAKWGVSELMTVNHPIASLILEYRGIEKMRSTYFEPLPDWQDDRLHPSFKPWGAVTGRMSCTNPSLMNLSNKSQNLAGEEENEEVLEAVKAMLGAREGQSVDMTSASGARAGGGTLSNLISYAKTYEETEDTVAVRRLYVPPEGYSLYCIDFSQMEMRVFADYVEDPQLHGLLESTDFDFHSHVAKEVWKVNEDSPLWKFYRNLAKAINFGMIYGIGNEKLASQIQKTVEEAEQYKAEYFARFPKARQFMYKVRDVVTTRGYIKNRFGRRYSLPPEKSYVGVNYLVQGTSADIVKNRMIAIREYLREHNYLSKMVVQVHDELLFYVKNEEELELVPELKRLLEERQINTYLPTEVSKGNPSWAEKEKMCVDCMNFKKECKCDQQKIDIG